MPPGGPVDFSDLGGKPVTVPPAGAIDFSDLGGKRVATAPQQPGVWQVLTQPTDKTDQEYTRYTGPAGVAGATIKGLDDVARSTRGALRGVWDTLTPALTDQEAQEGYTDTGRFGPVQVKRIAEPLISAAKQVPQIPATVRDINQSPDPTGRYLEAAQDTASQGAGQALAALATTGAVKTVPAAIRLGARGTEAAINQKLVPVRPILNLGTPADEAAAAQIKVPGRDFGLRKPVYPGAPLPESPGYNPGAPLPEHPGTFPGAPFPETPSPELLQARSLFEGSSTPQDPAAGLWTIKQSSAPAAGFAGQIADSMRKPVPSAEVAPGLNRGGLQDLLDKSLGAKKLDPKVPLRQQMPATSGTSVSTAPADAAAASSSSAEPEHMGQFARANGLELHQAIPETVEGDVLRAKIHDMSNVQVRQLAINSGVDMGQKPVTNAKNAGGVTRQQALQWIMMNHTPEEIGDMIDRGQHLPGPPSGAISSALAGNLK